MGKGKWMGTGMDGKGIEWGWDEMGIGMGMGLEWEWDEMGLGMRWE